MAAELICVRPDIDWREQVMKERLRRNDPRYCVRVLETLTEELMVCGPVERLEKEGLLNKGDLDYMALHYLRVKSANEGIKRAYGVR